MSSAVQCRAESTPPAFQAPVRKNVNPTTSGADPFTPDSIFKMTPLTVLCLVNTHPNMAAKEEGKYLASLSFAPELMSSIVGAKRKADTVNGSESPAKRIKYSPTPSSEPADDKKRIIRIVPFPEKVCTVSIWEGFRLGNP